MGKRVPCTPFGKKVKIEMVNQGMAQCELAKRLNLANSTIKMCIRDSTDVSVLPGILCGRQQRLCVRHCCMDRASDWHYHGNSVLGTEKVG